MEAVSDQKGYADLKTEFGQMRADISAIMNFLGMPERTIKARIATSFPRRYVDEEGSAASDSDNQGQVEHAMFALVKTGRATSAHRAYYGQ